MSRHRPELFRWLEEQEQQGEMDSSGAFTLRRERAWEKLGAFQLPFWSAWALKLLQAGVCLGAREVTVSQSRAETTFTFVGCDEVDRERLEAAIFDVGVEISSGYLNLGTAIRALAKGTELPFSVSFGDGQNLLWQGLRLVEVRGRASNAPPPPFKLSVSHVSWGNWKTIWTVASDATREVCVAISRTLSSHCYCSPIPVLLDGRRINGIHNDPKFGLSLTHQPLGVLSIDREPSLPSFSLEVGDRWRHNPKTDYQFRLKRQESEGSVDAAVVGVITAFFTHERHPRPQSRGAELVWVKEGVVVHREGLPYEGPVSFALLVSAEGLPTDLTDLSLRATEKYRSRRRAVLDAVGEWARRSSLSEPSDLVVETDGTLSSALLVGVGAVTLLFQPLLGLALMGASRVVPRIGKVATAPLEKSLQQAIGQMHEAMKAL